MTDLLRCLVGVEGDGGGIPLRMTIVFESTGCASLSSFDGLHGDGGEAGTTAAAAADGEILGEILGLKVSFEAEAVSTLSPSAGGGSFIVWHNIETSVCVWKIMIIVYKRKRKCRSITCIALCA